MTQTKVRRSVESYVWSFFEVPLALGLAVSVMLATAWLGCKSQRYGCPDVSGAGWLLGGALLGLVVGVVYWVMAFKLADRVRRRLIVDAAVLAVAIAPYLVAWVSDRLHEHRYAPSSTPPRISK